MDTARQTIASYLHTCREYQIRGQYKRVIQNLLTPRILAGSPATLRLFVLFFSPSTKQMSAVKEEISHYSSHYRARLTAHPNDTLFTLLETPEHRRLRCYLPNDLLTRFRV
jgi:hypothetical protein